MNIGDFDLDPMDSPAQWETVRFEAVPHELPGAERASAIIREALVPFVVWPDVPVRVLEPRQIGRMEAFLLEAAMDLGSFDLVELEDATSVPWHVIESSASRLRKRRALVEEEPGRYSVVEALASRILKDRNIDEEHVRHVVFVYFPRQDQLIANSEVANRLLRVSRKLRAPRQAPFRTDVSRNASVRDFLAERIEGRRVGGASQHIVALEDWEKCPEWPERSPCYYARGLVTGSGEGLVAELHLWGHERRRHTSRQYQCEQVRLVGTDVLVQEWMSLAQHFGATYRGMVEGLPRIAAQRIEPIGPCHWRIGIEWHDAFELATDRWLTEPLWISVRSSTAKVDVRISLEPMSQDAANLFIRDAIAHRIEDLSRRPSDQALEAEIRRALERYPLASIGSISPADLEERLWTMKRFMAIYRHRETEDFPYG